MSVERLQRIVERAVPILFDQIEGGRVPVQSEASLQLHLGRIVMTVADLEMVNPGETFSIELEKPLGGTGRGRLDVWPRAPPRARLGLPRWCRSTAWSGGSAHC